MILRAAEFTLLTCSAFAQTLFPPSVLPEASAIRYTRFLKALHESSLFDLSRDPAAEAYRLLWLRDHDRPASIRLVIKPTGRGWFYRRMTGGSGSTEPAGLREIGMSWCWKSRAASFLRIVDDTGFWTLPEPPAASDGICRSHWILEGVRGGRYRVIDRCSPSEDDAIRIIGVRAMRYANLRVHGRQIY